MAFSLQARVVFPVDRPPIEHGVVTIEGERIVAVGTLPVDGNVVDLGSVALLPGLVNAHTHLEFSHLSCPLGQSGMGLADWIRLVIAERSGKSSDRSRLIAAGVSESIKYGVTTIADIATAGPDAYPAALAFDTTVFLEVIGFSRARADSAFAAVNARLDELTHMRNRFPTGISPHAPYTVSPELLNQLVTLADRRNLPVAMHLAESAEELELLRDGTGPFQELLEERSMWDATAIRPGSRPIDYLKAVAKAPRAIVIHGNYLDSEEHAFLAAHRDRMSLVYCPRTHAYFRHQRYPLARLLSACVNVALGTDSRASNPDLSLLAEMRHVGRVHPEIDPATVLRMGTLAGAEALGRANDVGSLTPGKLANMVAIPLAEDANIARKDVLPAVLAGEMAPCAIWFRGQEVSPLS